MSDRYTYAARELAVTPKGRILAVPCSGCERAPAYYQPLDRNGEDVGKPKPLGAHCTTCHSGEHNACQGCGACLSRWAPVAGFVRSDKRYCSNACRQRAYRRRAA